MPIDKGEEFTCADCGETFENDWSVEEAMEELNKTFGLPEDQCDTVCGDCYNKLTARLRDAKVAGHA